VSILQKYIEYIYKWLSGKVAGSGNVYIVENAADELDIIKHYSGVQWEDVTDFPDLPAELKTTDLGDQARILLGERLFKKGRVYAPKSNSSGGGVTEIRRLQADLLVVGNTVLTVNTGYARWKKLNYIAFSGWTDATRTVKGIYGSPAVGGGNIVATRVEYNPAGPPAATPILDTIIFQAVGGGLNAALLGFRDLYIGFNPPIILPYYSDMRVTILNGPPAGSTATVLDVFVGVEVI